MKADKITVCIIGKEFVSLNDGIKRPHFEETEFQIVNIPNDWNYKDIIKHWDPNVFVTFGNWQNYKFLSVAPYDVRKKWIHLSESLTNDEIGNAIYNCYVGNVYRGNKLPLVSVFTVSFNSKEKIFRPFQSLLNQTYDNWEWVIFDDSNDKNETWNQLVEFSEMDPRIKPFKATRHSGIIGSIKRQACGLCSGEFLVELDHDDELTDNCLDWIVDTFIKNKDVGMVYTDYAEVYADTLENFEYSSGWGMGLGSYRSELYKGKQYSVTNEIPLEPQTLQHIVGVPNHVRSWRTGVYFSIGGHNPNLHVADDYDLILRTFLHSKILHIPHFGYIQYRNRDGNTTISRNKEIQRLVRLVFNHYESQIKQKCTELIKNSR